MAMTESFSFFFLYLLMGFGLTGYAPGDRDLRLQYTASPKTAVYVEWTAARPAKAGEWLADVEIQQFLTEVQKGNASATVVADEGEAPEAFNTPSEFLEAAQMHIPRLLPLFYQTNGCIALHYQMPKLFVKPQPKDDDTDEMPAPSAELLWMRGLRGSIVLTSKQPEQIDKLVETLSEVGRLSIPENGTDSKQPSAKDSAKLPNKWELPIPFLKASDNHWFLHRLENTLILAFSEQSLETAIAGLTQRTEGIQGNSRFAESWNQVQLASPGRIVFVDVPAMLPAIANATGIGEAFLTIGITAAGLKDCDAWISALGYDESGLLRQRSFLRTGGRTEGLFALTGGTPLKGQHFSQIPADADVVLAGSLGLQNILMQTRQLAALQGPQVVKLYDESIKQVELELGIKLDEELLAAFGDVWTAYDSPSNGGLGGTGMIVGWEVRDAVKAKKAYAQFVKLLQSSLTNDEDGTGLRDAEFLQHTIHYVHSQPIDILAGAPFPAASFCLTADQFLMAANPQAIKAHLRFRQTSEGTFDTKLAGRIPSFVDGKTLAVFYYDTPAIIRGAWPAIATMAPERILELRSALGSFDEHDEFDQADIPSVRAVAPYLRESSFSLQRTKTGLLVESHRPLPWISLISTAYWWMSTNGLFMHEAEALVGQGEPGLPNPAKRGRLARLATHPRPIPDRGIVRRDSDKKPTEPKPDAAPTTAGILLQHLGPVLLRTYLPAEADRVVPSSLIDRMISEALSPEAIAARKTAREAQIKLREEKQRERREARNPQRSRK